MRIPKTKIGNSNQVDKLYKIWNFRAYLTELIKIFSKNNLVKDHLKANYTNSSNYKLKLKKFRKNKMICKKN